MPYLDEDEIYEAYYDATTEADQWRIDYPEYERLADNGLMDMLDESLPEVNDGSLAASLFKMARRVIKKKISGRAIALDSDDAWITELANIIWEKKILKNAKSKASPRRKWKDAVRKAAIYGGQPIISLFVQRGSYTGADFIVPYAQDVKLEAGKDSDADCDIIFWDVYYSKLQVKRLLERAKSEQKEGDGYNEWNVEALQDIIDAFPDEDRPGNQEASSKQANGVKKSGAHFFIAFQRGDGSVDEEGNLIPSPFYMCQPGKTEGGSSTKGKWIRRWDNPDPTGDMPVHYLYYQQDFINPYGIGVVKLAGGTQNVLDFMRQYDVLATQLGVLPPKKIKGDEEQVDMDSLVYAQKANWKVGNADVVPVEMANGVYAQLPGRVSMYQTSLQKMIPTGDQTISGTDSGDPNVSKVPAAIKAQQTAMSVDDEDITDNVDECWAEVAASMINIHFANMQGNDLIKLNKEERQIMASAGIDWPVDPQGRLMGDNLDIIWDEARATFEFEVDPDADKTQDEEKALEGKLRAYEMLQADPTVDQQLLANGKRLNRGELLSDIFGQLTNNDKIIEDITPEEQDQMSAEQTGGIDPATGLPLPAQLPGRTAEASGMGASPQEPMTDPNEMTEEETAAGQQIEMVMQEYGVDENTAAFMLEAERQGYEPDEIVQYLGLQPQQQPAAEPELVNV